MIPNLKDIFKDRLVEDVSEFSNEYYYFYKDSNSRKLFGVLKTITPNEYLLLKEMYVEKKIYSDNKMSQKVYEYLLENNIYPFKSKKVKTILYKVKETDKEVVSSLISDIYENAVIIDIFNLNVCFIENDLNNIKDLFETISIDLGYDVNLHDGLIIDKSLNGDIMLSYIKAYHDSEKVYTMIYSDLADMILSIDVSSNKELLIKLKEYLFNKLFLDVSQREIISVMLKNDLNVSQSAKLLYMNRNSLINKLDTIYKETALNIQRFTHACAIYLMLNLL